MLFVSLSYIGQNVQELTSLEHQHWMKYTLERANCILLLKMQALNLSITMVVITKNSREQIQPLLAVDSKYKKNHRSLGRNI